MSRVEDSWLDALNGLQPYDDEDYAYRMGRDCALNGASTTNCDFRLFGTREMTKQWERGKASVEAKRT